MIIHFEIIVKGLVQGVSYRQYTKNKAQELKLAGYVRNLSNGDVEIQVEGPREKIQELIDWCHYGSPRSKVTDVLSSEKELVGYSNFIIK